MGMDRSAVREVLAALLSSVGDSAHPPHPKTLRKYLNDEHLDKKKTPFDFTDWSFPKGKGKVRVVPPERWTMIS